MRFTVPQSPQGRFPKARQSLLPEPAHGEDRESPQNRIKVNMQMRTDNIRRIGGRRQELVDDDVLRASLRLLRERSDAHIFVLDTSMVPVGQRPGDDFNMRPIFEEFDIPYVEAGDPPFTQYKVPGGGTMFSEYQLSARLAKAAAFVSIAKIKITPLWVITLCLKNLWFFASQTAPRSGENLLSSRYPAFIRPPDLA